MKLKASKVERLDDKSIKGVIALLEQESPITKKDACIKLNISYNTTRLANIIRDYKERKEREASIRKSLRNTELSFSEKKDIIQQYLSNTPLSEIAKSTFRPISKIKGLLIEYGIPLRSNTKSDYFKNVPLIPEKSVTKDYLEGDLVFSARYNCLAEISKLHGTTERDGNIYRIYLFGIEQQYAYQPYYELADLSGIKEEFSITIPGASGVTARPLQIK